MLAFHLIIWAWGGGNHLPNLHANSLVHSHFLIYAFRGDFYTGSKETVKNVIAFLANANGTRKAIWKPDVISRHIHALTCICTHNHVHAHTTQKIGSWNQMKRRAGKYKHMPHKQIQTKTMCQNEAAHKNNWKRKTADFSVPTQPKFSLMQHSDTYLMPTEGKESSAKVWETIFHSHAWRNPGEGSAIGEHEYSAWNLHVLSCSSFGPLVPCSIGCRCNQLCK